LAGALGLGLLVQGLDQCGLGFDGHQKGATLSVAPEVLQPDAEAEREHNDLNALL